MLRSRAVAGCFQYFWTPKMAQKQKNDGKIIISA